MEEINKLNARIERLWGKIKELQRHAKEAEAERGGDIAKAVDFLELI
jgi:hypothetical protein